MLKYSVVDELPDIPADIPEDDIYQGSLVVKADDFSRALTTQHISSLNDY